MTDDSAPIEKSLTSVIAKALGCILIPIGLVAAFMMVNHYHQRNDEGFYLRQTYIAYQTILEKGLFTGSLETFFLRAFRPIIHPFLAVPILFLTGGQQDLSVSLYVILCSSVFCYFTSRLLSDYVRGVERFVATLFVCLCPAVLQFSVGFNSMLPLLAALFGFLFYLKRSDFFRKRRESVLAGLFLGLAACIRPVEAFETAGLLGIGYFLRARQFGRVRLLDGFLYSLCVLAGGLVLAVQVRAPDVWPDDKNAAYLLVSLIVLIPLFFRKRFKLSKNFWWFGCIVYMISALWFAPVAKHLFSWIMGSSWIPVDKAQGHKPDSPFVFFGLMAWYFSWPLVAAALAVAVIRIQALNKFWKMAPMLIPAMIVPGLIGVSTGNGEYYYYLPSAVIAYMAAAILALGRDGRGRRLRVILMAGIASIPLLYQIQIVSKDPRLHGIRSLIGGPSPVLPIEHDPLDDIYAEFVKHLPAKPSHDGVGHACLLQMRQFNGLDWVADPFALELLCREHRTRWVFERISPNVKPTVPEKFAFVKEYCDYIFVLPTVYQHAPSVHFLSDVGEVILTAQKENRLKREGLVLEGGGPFSDAEGDTGQFAVFQPVTHLK